MKMAEYPTIEAQLKAFTERYPGYKTTTRLDELRATEYMRLDTNHQTYLDYTGSGLGAQAQFSAAVDRLYNGCFGNPHSENPTSLASTELVERARQEVLQFLNASPTEYEVIFTANASAACKIVAESYPFDNNNRFVLTFDNHNSVNGIREFARTSGAVVEYIPSPAPELRTSTRVVADVLRRSRLAQNRRPIPRQQSNQRHSGLFAFPAQSNFTGVQHPLSWVELAHAHGYDVLLDAAAYLPTNSLNLRVIQPDFVTVSWYKIFGYPTGVGCLVARKDALARLRRPWFSGGTIQAVSVQGDWHILAGGGAAFEDGTLNFLSIPDVSFGISWINSIGMNVIHDRVTYLTDWFLKRLDDLRHSNGAPMVLIYGPHSTKNRGATVAFNVLDPHGLVVDERLVCQEAAKERFSIRTGCFCNPGAGEEAFRITKEQVDRDQFRSQSLTIDEYIAAIGLPSGGAVRVSLGLVSNFYDVERFLEFCQYTYKDRVPDTSRLMPRLAC